MAVVSGFFNSDNGDRKYNADHFGRFFDGLIRDGVYVNYPEKNADGTYTNISQRGFHTYAGTGVTVNVAPGRCFFNHYWMYTDAVEVIDLSSLVPTNSLSKKLIAIFIDVDTAQSGRQIVLRAVAGAEVANDNQHTAEPPTPIETATRHQYPIALVAMFGTTSQIAAANVYTYDTKYTDYRKTYFAKTVSVEALLEYSSRSKAEMKDYIDDADLVLQNQVNDLKVPVFEEASTAANIAGSGETYKVILGKIKKVMSLVLGKLPISYGGTGQNTALGGFTALANGTTANTANIADADVFITKLSADSKYYNKTFSKVWDYIKSKLTVGVGLVYTNGQYKLKLKSETMLTTSSAAVGEVSGRVYPVQLDKDGNPAVNVPWTDDKSNDAVTQTAVTTGDASEYRVLFSATADDTTRTESAKKNTALKFKPSTGNLSATTFNGVKLAVSSGKYGYYDGSTFKPFKDPTGTAAAGDVLSGKTFANAASDAIVTGTMPNNGTVTKTLDTSTTSYTIAKGYHSGSGKVSLTKEEKTVTASRSAQTVTPSSGKVLSKVTVNKYPDASGTFTTSSNSSAVDMGATNNYRYVNTTGVYSAGRTQGRNDTFTETMKLRIAASPSGSFRNSDTAITYLYLNHVTDITVNGANNDSEAWLDANYYNSSDQLVASYSLVQAGVVLAKKAIPSGAAYCRLQLHAEYNPTIGQWPECTVTLTITRRYTTVSH